ncbi:MAG: serine/threonine-protein kinase [Isosphaeraceae bacterium]|nr:serine/threonine-protein kinase [Isosphaeraceae bacterium]
MGKVDDFALNSIRSGLVPPEVIERARARLDGSRLSPDDAESFARFLIEAGYLTNYQARKLLAGATRGFFLGGFRILRRLGEGGMGKVYLGRSESDGKRVAIKVLPPSKAAASSQALARFRREMDLSRRVVHANLAQTLDVGVDDDVYFMILEYVPGKTLYEIVKGPDGGPLRVPDTAKLFLGILEGLDAAHSAGLIHRDMKPSNVMVTPTGQPKILDLGLARGLEEEGAMTRPNVAVGTLDYASPEQLTNAASADRRSDLYSVGCMLYFVLAGRAPFEGGDILNKMFKHRMDEADPLERVARGVPSAFAAIVRKLMAKNPADRHQNCRELAVDLQRWTDPVVVRGILGAAAESARAFRPPPPSLEDEDLRFQSGDSPGSSIMSLRELGTDVPAPAPMRKPAPGPKTAILLVDEGDPSVIALRGGPSTLAELFGDRTWRAHWIALGLAMLSLLFLALYVFSPIEDR